MYCSCSGYIDGDHPIGTTNDTFGATVYFAYGSNLKYREKDINITNCGSYYVYYLTSTGGRYCTDD